MQASPSPGCVCHLEKKREKKSNENIGIHTIGALIATEAAHSFGARTEVLRGGPGARLLLTGQVA